MKRIVLLAFGLISLLSGSLSQAAEQEYKVEVTSFKVDHRFLSFDQVANDLMLSIKEKLSRINGIPANEMLFFLKDELVDDYDTVGKYSQEFNRGIPLHLRSISGEPVSVKYGYNLPGEICCEVRHKTNTRPQKDREFKKDND